jgi:hypothetical protein
MKLVGCARLRDSDCIYDSDGETSCETWIWKTKKGMEVNIIIDLWRVGWWVEGEWNYLFVYLWFSLVHLEQLILYSIEW